MSTDNEILVYELQKRIRELLKRTAQVIRPCKVCGTPLAFVIHPGTGKLTPYTMDGVNHFVNCPQVAKFKKQKGTA